MTTPAVGPASSAKAQATQRNRIRKRASLISLAVKEWMETPGGRLLLFWLLDDVCDVDGGSFVVDPHQTAFNEGIRSVGIAVRERVQAAVPGLFIQAMGEEIKRRADEQALREAEDMDLGDPDE